MLPSATFRPSCRGWWRRHVALFRHRGSNAIRPFQGIGESPIRVRPFLHAGRLAFPHPSGSGISSFAEPLPAELEAFLEILGPPDEQTGTGSDANGSPVA